VKEAKAKAKTMSDESFLGFKTATHTRVASDVFEALQEATTDVAFKIAPNKKPEFQSESFGEGYQISVSIPPDSYCYEINVLKSPLTEKKISPKDADLKLGVFSHHRVHSFPELVSTINLLGTSLKKEES
jgi:hypothetical protein